MDEYLLYDKIFLGRRSTHMSTNPQKESMTGQSMDVTKVQLGEPVRFIEVAYVNMGKRYLQDQPWLKGLTASGNSTGWRASFPRDSGPHLFQAARLLTVFSAAPLASPRATLHLPLPPAGRSQEGLLQFQELLGAILSCLPFCLTSFPAGWRKQPHIMRGSRENLQGCV